MGTKLRTDVSNSHLRFDRRTASLRQCGQATGTEVVLVNRFASAPDNHIGQKGQRDRGLPRLQLDVPLHVIDPTNVMAGKEENTQPPALVAGSSLPTLAIRPRFY